MSIEKDKEYILIYSPISFYKNKNLFSKIKKDFKFEIPYFDIPFLSEEMRNTLDNYLYLEVNEYVKNILTILNHKYRPFRFIDLGKLFGEEILKLINNCISEVRDAIKIGDYYRIDKGHPLSNLIIKVVSIKEDIVLGCFHTYQGERSIEVPISKIKIFKNPYIIKPKFINYLRREQDMGNYRAIIIDGHNILYKSMFGFKNLYRSRDHKFVGGAYGFYFTLLKLKELFPEYEIYVVFDGYDKIKFEENLEYKKDRLEKTEKFKENFKYNLNWVKAFSSSLGFRVHHLMDKEGDDVIGSISNFLDKKLGYQHILIYSRDIDFYSILNEKVNIYLPRLEFRNRANIITVKEALEKFEVNSIDKINWVKAITGDISDSIIKINTFNSNYGLKSFRVKKQNYLNLINSCTDIEDLKSELIRNKKFKLFIESGQFDRNLKLLTINKDIFEGYRDLDCFLGISSKECSISLLEDFSFFREVEVIDRNYRIFQGIW